jgi:hypothetical protein
MIDTVNSIRSRKPALALDSEDEHDTEVNQRASSRPQSAAFRHSSVFLSALFVPNLILLSFGGRWSVLALGFGSLVVYIFDLLGSIEGSFMAIVLTTLTLWGTFVWAGRLLIYESWMNLPKDFLSRRIGLFCHHSVVVIHDYYMVFMH